MAISCTRTQDQLLDWLHHEVPVAEAREIETHIDGCQQCQLRHEELLSLTSELFSLPHPSPPADLPAQIRRNIEREMQRTPSVWAPWRATLKSAFAWKRVLVFRVVPAALMLLVAFVVGKTAFWPDAPVSTERRDLAFQMGDGIKRVSFGGLKRQALQIPEVSQEFPEAATNAWGQPARPNHWNKAEESSTPNAEQTP